MPSAVFVSCAPLRCPSPPAPATPAPQLLLELAAAADVRGKIDAMFAGARINSTEGRAVLHAALRAPREAVMEEAGKNVVPEVWAVLDKIKAFTGGVGWGGVAQLGGSAAWGRLLLGWEGWANPGWQQGWRLGRVAGCTGTPGRKEGCFEWKAQMAESGHITRVSTGPPACPASHPAPLQSGCAAAGGWASPASP
jgi:hypothetical protein